MERVTDDVVAGNLDPWTAADELLNPVLSFDNGRIAHDPPDGSAHGNATDTQLADDPLRVAQIAPPDIDDLPAELTQHPLSPSVPVRPSVWHATPSSDIRLRPCAADRRGRARPGGCRREYVLGIRRRDGCRPWPGSGRRCAGTSSGQPIVDPLAEQHQQRGRSGAASSPPRLGNGPQLVGRHALTQRAVQRPSWSARCRRPGRAEPGCWDRHRRDLAYRYQVLEDRPTRVMHRGTGRAVGWRPGSR